MAKPHEPARKIGKDVPNPEDLSNSSYPNVPDDSPGLVGGPATEAVPGSHDIHDGAATVTNDGGETSLPGRPRETGGMRADPKRREDQVNT
jgi:hypothetical protein